MLSPYNITTTKRDVERKKFDDWKEGKTKCPNTCPYQYCKTRKKGYRTGCLLYSLRYRIWRSLPHVKCLGKKSKNCQKCWNMAKGCKIYNETNKM